MFTVCSHAHMNNNAQKTPENSKTVCSLPLSLSCAGLCAVVDLSEVRWSKVAAKCLLTKKICAGKFRSADTLLPWS